MGWFELNPMVLKYFISLPSTDHNLGIVPNNNIPQP